jgi:hypothetical protein
MYTNVLLSLKWHILSDKPQKKRLLGIRVQPILYGLTHNRIK